MFFILNKAEIKYLSEMLRDRLASWIYLTHNNKAAGFEWRGPTRDNKQNASGAATSKPDRDWYTADSHSCISRFWLSGNLWGHPTVCFTKQMSSRKIRSKPKQIRLRHLFFFSLILFLFFLFDANCLTKNSQSLIHISWAAGFLKVGTVSSAHSYKCRSAPPVGMESQISGSKNLKM